MSFFEKAVASVSPTWALKRARDRAKLEVLRAGMDRVRRFEGADRGRRTQGWLSPDSSPISATRGALHELRARTRDLSRNNPWAGAAVRNLVSNLVGDGIRPKFEHEDDETERKFRQLWADWADSTTCDAGGRNTHGAMQAAVTQSMIDGGQALVRRRFRRLTDELPCPLQLQALEGDFIDTSKDGTQDERGNRNLQGKAFNAFGRLTGYWLFREHPGEMLWGSNFESVFVPAAGVLDVYREDRLGQVRGVPWGAPCVLRLKELDSYEDNEAVRMVVATAFSAFVHDLSAEAGFDEGVGPVDAAGGPIRNDKGQVSDELEPGTIEFLPPGKTITFPNVPQNEGYAAFVRAQLLGIAKGYGTTFESMTGDYTGANFTTGRMADIVYRRDLSRWRSHIIVPHFCQPSLLWWLEGLAIAGLATPAEIEGLSWVWIPPRQEMIDPRTETEATIAEVRGGLKSLRQVVHAMGRDAEEVLVELSDDLKLARELGLSLSVDGEQDDPGMIRTVNASNGSERGLPGSRGTLEDARHALEGTRLNGRTP